MAQLRLTVIVHLAVPFTALLDPCVTSALPSPRMAAALAS